MTEPGFRFDPSKAEAAERMLREAADLAQQALLEAGSAVTDYHRQFHPFGTSPEATQLANTWDQASDVRGAEAARVRDEAEEMADALRESTDTYRRDDGSAAETFKAM